MLGLSFMVAVMISRRSARAYATIERQAEQLTRQSVASYRFVPVKVMEENRRVINDTLAAKGVKVSFTHLIAWAIVEALAK